jgi:hypothetical protein
MKDLTKMKFMDWLESKLTPWKVAIVMADLALLLEAERRYEDYLND